MRRYSKNARAHVTDCISRNASSESKPSLGEEKPSTMYYTSVVYQQSTTIPGEGLHVINKLAFTGNVASLTLTAWLDGVDIDTRRDFKVRSVRIARNMP